MADYATEQNLRMAQKMLEQQGEINSLRAERDALAERVRVAEILCTIYGGTANPHGNDWDKACTQAYMNWAHAYGTPAVTNDLRLLVARLAIQRDEIRTATLDRIERTGR